MLPVAILRSIRPHPPRQSFHPPCRCPLLTGVFT